MNLVKRKAAQLPTAPVHDAGWRYAPHSIIFFSSACIMVVELVAGRLTGRHLGTSLYTWTSIIGVVLAGMSVGNWLGGRMADRFEPRRLLGWLFLASSITCVICLLLNKLMAEVGQSDAGAEAGMSYPVRVFISMAIIFLLPALALGMISPVTAKMALMRGLGVGRTIGSVYAWGAVGSIVGTFLTGYWLIAWLGSTGVVLAVAMALSVVGLVLGPARILLAVWLALLAGLMWLTRTQEGSWFGLACAMGLQDGYVDASGPSRGRYEPFVFARDSHYQLVKIQAMASEWRPRGRELLLDTDRHSFVDLDDPSYLHYQYQQIYGYLIERLFVPRIPISAFFVGGGGYTLPRWVQHRYPGSTCEVAEIDPVVLDACHEALGLPRDTTIKSHLNDARVVVRQLPAGRKYDLIIGDAFNNELTIPWHLTTLEFHRDLKRRLKPDGFFLANVIDDYEKGGLLLGSYVRTLGKLFRRIHVFCTVPDGVTGGRDNFIVAATDREDAALHERLAGLLPGNTDTLSGSRLSDDDLARVMLKTDGRILTDDDAPVENLIAPVIR
jgi:spermidine synthase